MIDEIIAILLGLVTIKSEEDSLPVDGLAEAAHDALTAGLSIIPVERFMTAIQSVISSDHELVRAVSNIISSYCD